MRTERDLGTATQYRADGRATVARINIDHTDAKRKYYFHIRCARCVAFLGRTAVRLHAGTMRSRNPITADPRPLQPDRRKSSRVEWKRRWKAFDSQHGRDTGRWTIAGMTGRFGATRRCAWRRLPNRATIRSAERIAITRSRITGYGKLGRFLYSTFCNNEILR